MHANRRVRDEGAGAAHRVLGRAGRGFRHEIGAPAASLRLGVSLRLRVFEARGGAGEVGRGGRGERAGPPGQLRMVGVCAQKAGARLKPRGVCSAGYEISEIAGSRAV